MNIFAQLVALSKEIAGLGKTETAQTEAQKAAAARRALVFSKVAEKLGKKQKFETVEYLLKNGTPVLYDTDTMTAIGTLNGVEVTLPEAVYALADGGTLEVKDWQAAAVVEPVIEEVMAENEEVKEIMADETATPEETLAAQEAMAQFKKVAAERTTFAAEVEKFKAENVELKTKLDAALKAAADNAEKFGKLAAQPAAKPETGEKTPAEIAALIEQKFSQVETLR